MSAKVAVDLRNSFGLIRDQGPRPTCLAFAVSDAHASLRDGWTPLSVEYIFYHAQKHSGSGPDTGCKACSLLKALECEGQPIESAWPYTSRIPDPWEPPSSEFKTFKRVGTMAKTSFESVISILDRGIPVVLILLLSKCFFEAGPNEIIHDVESDPPNPAQQHAVIAVAYGTIPGNEMAILVRNSWGKSWATRGYAWLSESFLKHRLISQITLEPN